MLFSILVLDRLLKIIKQNTWYLLVILVSLVILTRPPSLSFSHISFIRHFDFSSTSHRRIRETAFFLTLYTYRIYSDTIQQIVLRTRVYEKTTDRTILLVLYFIIRSPYGTDPSVHYRFSTKILVLKIPNQKELLWLNLVLIFPHRFERTLRNVKFIIKLKVAEKTNVFPIFK